MGNKTVKAGTPSPAWALLDGYQVRKDGRPYLDRLRIFQTPWFSVMLHRIHGPDGDRDPHDHPWPFLSLILSGGYAEQVWPDPRVRAVSVSRLRKRWSLASMPLSAAHQINSVHGVLWTLVVTGRRHESWRFWTPDGPVDWKDYLKAGEDTDG